MHRDPVFFSLIDNADGEGQFMNRPDLREGRFMNRPFLGLFIKYLTFTLNYRIFIPVFETLKIISDNQKR
jgi:hypothetical protein